MMMDRIIDLKPGDDRIIRVITSDYSNDLVAKMRAVPGRQYDPDLPGWTAPIREFPMIRSICGDFTFAPDLLVKIKADQKALMRAQAMTRQLREAALQRLDVNAALPCGDYLFAHQKIAARRMIERSRMILADDMGLGKTRTALVAAKAWRVPIVVIAPAFLQENWRREARAVGTPIHPYSWAKIPELPYDEPFVLICDEAHYAQTMESKRTREMLNLAHSEHCIACYMLTGTPIKNGRPINMYPLLYAVDHWIAHDKVNFDMYYCDASRTRYKRWDLSGAKHLDELHKNTKDAVIRRTKDDCLDLPPKMRVMRSVELSEDARRVYQQTFDDLKNEYKLNWIQKRALAQNVGEYNDSILMAVQMLMANRQAASMGKVAAAVELATEVIEQGGSVVLFTAFKEPGKLIADALKCQFLSGDSPASRRQFMVDDLQSGKRRALVCSYGAGGVGFTMTAAQTVILVDRIWTPGDVAQAEDRLHRYGQRSAVTSIWLQCDDTDMAIDALLQKKAERIDLVLSGKRKTLRGTSDPKEIAKQVIQTLFD